MSLKFILLFPILFVPATLMLMIRPWVILEELLERDSLLGVPIFKNKRVKNKDDAKRL